MITFTILLTFICYLVVKEDLKNLKMKRSRIPNYSKDEKLALLHLVKSKENIVDCKKTDAVTSGDKLKCWEEIAIQFNRKSPSGVPRSSDSLRKCYDNIKQEAKKAAAENRVESLRTGGGPPPPSLNPLHELALSIINAKTVYGFYNINDSDGIHSAGPSNCVVLDTFENDTNEQTETEKEDSHTPWKKSKPADLQTPLSSDLNRKMRSNGACNRRRTPQVRALTSSFVADKYDKLLQKRIAILDAQQREINDKKSREEEEWELKKSLLISQRSEVEERRKLQAEKWAIEKSFLQKRLSSD